MNGEGTYLIWSGKENERVTSERDRKRRKCSVSRAGKVEVLQSCSWACREGPVPQGCLPVVPWNGKRNSPQFHSPNSKNALFVIKEDCGHHGSPRATPLSRDLQSHPKHQWQKLFAIHCLVTETPHQYHHRIWGEMFTINNVSFGLSTINNVYFGLFPPVWVWGQRHWCYLADLFMFRRRVEEGGVYPWSRWLFQAALEESAHLIGIQSASLAPISL